MVIDIINTLSLYPTDYFSFIFPNLVLDLPFDIGDYVRRHVRC